MCLLSFRKRKKEGREEKDGNFVFAPPVSKGGKKRTTGRSQPREKGKGRGGEKKKKEFLAFLRRKPQTKKGRRLGGKGQKGKRGGGVTIQELSFQKGGKKGRCGFPCFRSGVRGGGGKREKKRGGDRRKGRSKKKTNCSPLKGKKRGGFFFVFLGGGEKKISTPDGICLNRGGKGEEGAARLVPPPRVGGREKKAERATHGKGKEGLRPCG